MILRKRLNLEKILSKTSQISETHALIQVRKKNFFPISSNTIEETVTVKVDIEHVLKRFQL